MTRLASKKERRTFFRPSGGLIYHWRALRSRERWRPFSNDLERWLNSWREPGGKLVLIGPSGGYTLPTDWLRGFSEIHAYDIDPLAAFFFNLRHRGVHAEFHNQDVFWRERKLSTSAIETCVRSHSGAVILFCNVLGQLPLEGQVSEADLARFLQQMRASLNGVSWASYHDLFTVEPLEDSYHWTAANDFRSGGDPRKEPPAAPKVEIIDHLLEGEWCEGLQRARLAWSLNPQSLHLIEGVSASER